MWFCLQWIDFSQSMWCKYIVRWNQQQRNMMLTLIELIQNEWECWKTDYYWIMNQLSSFFQPCWFRFIIAIVSINFLFIVASSYSIMSTFPESHHQVNPHPWLLQRTNQPYLNSISNFIQIIVTMNEWMTDCTSIVQLFSWHHTSVNKLYICVIKNSL